MLKTWVAANPHLCYWQGLDSLSAPHIVLHFGDEALAMACLQAMVAKYLRNFFVTGMRGKCVRNAYGMRTECVRNACVSGPALFTLLLPHLPYFHLFRQLGGDAGASCGLCPAGRIP